jgi:hypothetical protein
MDGAMPIFNFNYCCAVFGTKTNPKCNGQNECSSKKPFSPQRAAKEKAILSIILKQNVKQ